MAELLSTNKTKKFVDAVWLNELRIGERATFLSKTDGIVSTSPVTAVFFVNKGGALFETKNTRYEVRYPYRTDGGAVVENGYIHQ